MTIRARQQLLRTLVKDSFADVDDGPREFLLTIHWQVVSTYAFGERKAHGGDPAEVRHICMDMSAAYANGGGMALPQARGRYRTLWHIRNFRNGRADGRLTRPLLSAG